jgi:hypothetical protein
MATRDPEKIKAARERQNAKRRTGVGKGNGRHLRGADHYRWKDGRMIASHGYVKVRVGRTHPLADPNGYAYEHIMVMVTALGRSLGPDEIVHHRNANKLDNRLENLELLTRAEHAMHHNAHRTRDELGRFGGRTHAAGGRELDGREWSEYPT